MLLQGFPRRPFIYLGSSLQGQVDPQNHHSQYCHQAFKDIKPSSLQGQVDPQNHHSQHCQHHQRPPCHPWEVGETQRASLEIISAITFQPHFNRIMVFLGLSRF